MLLATSLQLLPDWVEWLHTSLSAANPLLHSISIYGVKSTHMYKYIGHTLKPQDFCWCAHFQSTHITPEEQEAAIINSPWRAFIISSWGLAPGD